MRFLLRLLPLLLFLCAGLLTAPHAYAHGNDLTHPPQLERTPKFRAAANTYAPDVKPSALWDGRKMLDFYAIDNPKMIAASKFQIP